MTLPNALLVLVVSVLLGRPTLAHGGELELERQFWADPQLSSAQVRVDARAGGRSSVRVTAATREAVERAKLLLADSPGVESFQVDFDPRLQRPKGQSAGGPDLDRARAALQADPGTRLSAGLLDQARFDPEGVLLLPESRDLEPTSRRRLARLLLAQPGIGALRFASDTRLTAATTHGPSGTSAPRQPTRTRIQLDPLQPEAAAIARDEPHRRTLLHADVPPAPADASESGGRQAEVPAEEPAPAALSAPTAPPTAVDLEESSRGESEAPLEEAPPAALDAPTVPSGTTPAMGTSRSAKLDQAVEDSLAQTLELEGAPKTLKARVNSGVVVFGGQVPTRELAVRLRELTRNFDGVTRVTGGLRVESTGEQVPMDALPD